MPKDVNQLPLFGVNTGIDTVAPPHERPGRVREVVSLAHGAVLDTRLVEIHGENLEDNTGFTLGMSDRRFLTDAEAGKNTAVRTERSPRKLLRTSRGDGPPAHVSAQFSEREDFTGVAEQGRDGIAKRNSDA